MKYCQHCGAQLMDEAVICPSCGCAVESRQAKAETSSMLKLIAKIFMILGCISTGWCIIPLIWTIPMTVHYWKSVENRTPVSTGFKICSLLFVNLIAGILMLCDNEDKQTY